MDISFQICIPATSFKGLHHNETIEGSFESGKFEGHQFFNGNWVQAVLLNYYKDFERTLTNGNRTNRRVKILLDFYEWIPAYGSAGAREHYGSNSFNNKVNLFKLAGFSDEFISILNNYIPIECPMLRQWKLLSTFDRRPLVAL